MADLLGIETTGARTRRRPRGNGQGNRIVMTVHEHLLCLQRVRQDGTGLCGLVPPPDRARAQRRAAGSSLPRPCHGGAARSTIVAGQARGAAGGAAARHAGTGASSDRDARAGRAGPHRPGAYAGRPVCGRHIAACVRRPLPSRTRAQSAPGRRAVCHARGKGLPVAPGRPRRTGAGADARTARGHCGQTPDGPMRAGARTEPHAARDGGSLTSRRPVARVAADGGALSDGCGRAAQDKGGGRAAISGQAAYTASGTGMDEGDGCRKWRRGQQTARRRMMRHCAAGKRKRGKGDMGPPRRADAACGKENARQTVSVGRIPGYWEGEDCRMTWGLLALTGPSGRRPIPYGTDRKNSPAKMAR